MDTIRVCTESWLWEKNTAQLLVHVIAHLGQRRHCKSVLEVDWEKNPLLHQGLKPMSVLCPAFQLNTLPTELSPIRFFVEYYFGAGSNVWLGKGGKNGDACVP